MKCLVAVQPNCEQQKGSSLLAQNVNLAPIKAFIGTSVDNRKSLFTKKHPVVGLRVYDPSCWMAVQRHIGTVTLLDRAFVNKATISSR